MFSTILCLKLSADISETVFLPVRNSVLESENKNRLKMCFLIPGNGNMKISSNRTISLYRYERLLQFKMDQEKWSKLLNDDNEDIKRIMAIECENCQGTDFQIQDGATFCVSCKIYFI